MCVCICILYLSGSLFRVRVQGTMRCCGREIFKDDDEDIPQVLVNQVLVLIQYVKLNVNIFSVMFCTSNSHANIARRCTGEKARVYDSLHYPVTYDPLHYPVKFCYSNDNSNHNFVLQTSWSTVSFPKRLYCTKEPNLRNLLTVAYLRKLLELCNLH